jgi:hypothetical protein
MWGRGPALYKHNLKKKKKKILHNVLRLIGTVLDATEMLTEIDELR